MAGIDALWRVLGMRSIIFRVLAGLIGIGFFWVFYVTRNNPGNDLGIGHCYIAFIFLAYAILGNKLGGKWT